MEEYKIMHSYFENYLSMILFMYCLCKNHSTCLHIILFYSDCYIVTGENRYFVFDIHKIITEIKLKPVMVVLFIKIESIT